MKHVKRGFASDNNAAVHPSILEAIYRANKGHVVGYGDDQYTKEAKELIKHEFGAHADVYFVFNGTGANVLSIAAAASSFQSVICAETSHIHEDECGAPEKFSGSKLLPVHASDGKLTPELIATQMKGINFVHHVQPRIVSITQSTELGTVYTVDEIKRIAQYAHQNNMILHMDGARIYNAAVHLKKDLKALTCDAGVDILSLGGTKNGIMMGEAVLVFNKVLTPDIHYYHKQSMQLASKMRFIAVQYQALLQNGLWHKNASHANQMAEYLKEKTEPLNEISIVYPVESNAVFAKIPKDIIPSLQEKFFFYVWDDRESIVRWMTSFDTEREDIDELVKLINQFVN